VKISLSSIASTWLIDRDGLPARLSKVWNWQTQACAAVNWQAK